MSRVCSPYVLEEDALASSVHLHALAIMYTREVERGRER